MKCLLNGVHVDATGNVGWVFTTGVEPHIQAFEMKAGEVESFLKTAGNVKLEIIDQRTVTVDKLSVVGEGPSSAPMYRTLLISDLRWKWRRKLITGAYNLRRRTGQKTLLTDSLVELAQVVDDFEFAPASLKNEITKWTPKELVEDILTKLSDGEGFEFPFLVETDTDQLEVNDVLLRDPGPRAIERALTHLPGSMLWVDGEGKVHVESAIGLKEAKVIERMGPDIVNEGHVSKVSYRLTRPKKINVYFVREQEVRHDSIEGTETATVDGRFMRTVCLVTDPIATAAGQQVSFGSWSAFDDLFTFWNQSLPSVGGAIGTSPPISHGIIQAAFFHDALFRLYVPFGDEVAQPIWSGRISAIKTHYRQTFKLNRRWVDRSFQILPVRAALFDPTTGTRGRSQVYGDYCVRVSALPAALKANKGNLWKNVYGGGDRVQFNAATLISNASVTPALVSMVDDQAGIIHFDYVVDPYGAYKQIFPCLCVNLPTAVMNDSAPRGVNMKVGWGGAIPSLSPSFHCATVLTHVPSMPNNNGQFYKIEVKPEDVTGLVKGLAIDPCEGPPWEIYVDSGLITARMAWVDSQSNVIERSFGVNNNGAGGAVGAVARNENDNEILRTLLVNEDQLLVVAQAKAAAIWSKMTDRYIGAKTVRLDSSLTLKGSMESLAHYVDAEGAVLSRVTLPEELQDRDFGALLSEGTRRVIFREVIPE